MTALRHEHGGLILNYTAGGTINQRRIVKFSTSGTTGDKVVVQAAAATDLLLGVSKVPQGQDQRVIQSGSTPPTIPVVTSAAGDRIDIIHSGVAEVDYGGTITRGQLVTSDADGKAVAAAPAAGVNNRVIGIAMLSGVDGDVGAVMLCPHQIQGA